MSSGSHGDGAFGLDGVVPPTVTAFDADGALDTTGTAAHARYVVEGGASGVLPLGTNGEFAMLSAEERTRVVECVVDEVGDTVPVVAGVGEPSTRETVARSRAARAAGADGLVVVTPYYYPVDGEGIVEHYRRVTEAIDCPVYAYHIPSKTGNEIGLETLSALADLDGLAGLKDSSKDVPWLGQAVDANPELEFLVGSDALLFTGLSLGCTGLVSAVANVFPELVVECYEAHAAGETERARAVQSRVFDVRSAIKRGPYMSGVKAALSLLDVEFEVGGLRPPLRSMDDEQQAVLAADLRALDLL